MDQVSEFFSQLLLSNSWPARWHCGNWTTFHGWLYILSSLIISAAYFLIPISLIYFITKRKKDVPFPTLVWLFILFILSCGLTHFMDALAFWQPMYRFNALLLFFTAVISMLTVTYMYRVLPEAMKLTSPRELEKIVILRTRELAQKNKDLIRLNQEMDSFVYSTSHDLKSPINNLTGLIAILKLEMPQGNAAVNDLIDRMESSSSRARSAIQNLTDILKVHTDPYDDIQEIDLRQLVQEILDENEIMVKGNGTIISYRLTTEHVHFSKTALKSILYNLITNAIKYRSQERPPHIKITSLPEEGNNVELFVADNGLGIDMTMYGDKLFGLFKRFHDHLEGSGIGLYTVRKILESKGGTITAESTVNKGTTFKIVIPQ